MIKIDYIREGIKNINDFYGRRELIEEICHRLKSWQSVSLYGERKMGKTSLLKYLFQEGIKQVPFPNPSQVIILYETFGGKQDTTEEIFLQGLYDTLNRNINLPVEPGKMDKNGFNKFIDDSRCRGKHFIFFFDEIDAASENSAFDHTFFSFLRSLSDKYQVQYIIASRKSIKQLIRENNVASPFNGLFSGNLFKLEVFKPEEAEGFCRKLSRDALAGNAIETEPIIRLAGRHPFLIRLAFYHAVDLAVKSIDNRPDYEQLKSKYEKESYHAYFLDIWSHLEAAERLLLKNISLKAALDHLKLSEKEMIDDFKSKGLLFQDEEDNYTFFNGYFAEFIR
ncbi:MAG: AAA-like domain-containing protein, partial [Candidatus Aminicenantes bacterium]|nr:AAA-like domain-containing protein [Candidatus Aminicenantes bacterium]